MARRLLAWAALAVALALPTTAHGHAAFVGSTPQPGERVEDAPSAVELRFTEPLNLALTAVTLRLGGEVVEIPVRAGGERMLRLDTADLRTGSYRVEWRTVSTQDGHPLQGTFSFGVRAAAASGVHLVEQSPFASGGGPRIAARIGLYAFALLLTAALLIPRFLGRDWLSTAAARRERRLTETLAWGAVVAAILATAADAAAAGGRLGVATLSDYLLTNVPGVARLAVVAGLVTAAATWKRWPRVAAGFVVVALGAIAASGHAGSATPRVPAIVNDWLHLLSGALWLGGIGVLALVWALPLRRAAPAERREVVATVLAPFGRVAIPAFVVVVATGLISLLTQLGNVPALWETGYGRLLAAKIVLVGLLAAASAWHAFRLRPQILEGRAHAQTERRHWRLLRSEPLLGTGIVVLVAVVVAFPLPPRQLANTQEAQAAQPTCAPCPMPKPKADELPVAAQAGSVLVGAWIRRKSRALRGELRLIDIRGAAAEASVDVADGSVESCGLGCWRFETPLADRLRVGVTDGGRRFVAELPSRWAAGDDAAARLLLRRAEAAMRDLRSVRQTEEVSSGPGSYAWTEFRAAAPDRMSLRTNRGVRRIIVGRQQWSSIDGSRWKRTPYGSGLAFSTRSWFRWTTFARSVRLLGVRRGTATIALFEEGTPVWLRLTIDQRTGRVLREEMTSRAHFMRTRYDGFDERVRIEPPAGR